jgi:putative NIF3 family GTP cyclohydrolase 1 type 2
MAYTVRDIEQLLFAAYPARDAQEGDRVGLLVGDPAATVTRIALALDVTVDMLDAAVAQGCNVLVTHHPVFWFAPESFLKCDSPAQSSGAVIFAAADKGVALINMHTNLDTAPSAATMLLEPVGLAYHAPLLPMHEAVPVDCAHLTLDAMTACAVKDPRPAAKDDTAEAPVNPSVPSLGQVAVPATGGPLTLEALAYRYRDAFGQVAKVWGDPAKPLTTIAVCSGGAGEVIPQVLAAHADCFVLGELRHHEALWLQDAGIAVIELGHDTSELPYRFYLCDALKRAGFAHDDLVLLQPTATWWQPTAR